MVKSPSKYSPIKQDANYPNKMLNKILAKLKRQPRTKRKKTQKNLTKEELNAALKIQTLSSRNKELILLTALTQTEQYLYKRIKKLEPCTINELQKNLNTTKENLKKHLKPLTNLELITFKDNKICLKKQE